MPLTPRDIVLTEAAAKALDRLETRAKTDSKAASILAAVRRLRAVLIRDALHGEVVKKPLPRALVVKHGVKNLYVEDLPDFWRLIYTVVRVDLEPFVVVVEIVDHKAYDKWF